MNISQAEHTFFKTIADLFSPGFPLGQSLLVTGQWKEAQEKLMLLLCNKLTVSPYNLAGLGISSFNFPFAVAFVSYQEGIRDKHATYYQQRFHATEVDEVITLRKFLFGDRLNYSAVHKNYVLLEQFNLKHLLDEEVIKLSNGETRKASILKALLSNPQILVMDNPYAGIDSNTLPELDQLFEQLTQQGLSLILFGNPELSSYISRVLVIDSPEEISVMDRSEYLRLSNKKTETNLLADIAVPPLKKPEAATVVKLTNVSVSYGEKQVLKNITWVIKAGEKWVLKGANGAGKSTLLSLIYADHPQCYANDIELFGKKRGTGESIWDIKENIALYSPELYYYFDKTLTCEQAILSGIYFHPFKKGVKYPDLEDYSRRLFQLFFDVAQLTRPLNSLPGVQQRLVLLIRALAQNASLVLLDEPFQGFDRDLTEKCKRLTTACCHDKTLIFISHHEGDIPEGMDKVYLLK